VPPTTELLNDCYQRLLSGRASWQWQRIGAQRRAGVTAPLFSVFSEASCGIGEFPDIRLLVDWCRKTGVSFIQLLPINDVGFAFRPYDAQSMFALDPMHLRLHHLRGVEPGKWDNAIQALRERFPTGRGRVDYRIKGAKLELLWRIFEESAAKIPAAGMTAYIKDNAYWLEDYALFRAIKEQHQERGWTDWPRELKERRPAACETFVRSCSRTLLFQKWLQWQLFEQLRDTTPPRTVSSSWAICRSSSRATAPMSGPIRTTSSWTSPRARRRTCSTPRANAGACRRTTGPLSRTTGMTP